MASWRSAILLALITSSVWLATAEQSRTVNNGALKNGGKTGEDWLTYGLTLSETRFSPLESINANNVRQLDLVWSYDLGSGGGPQGTPLVWNGALYGITNWSVVFAVDARTGKERWRWDPEVNQAAVLPKICCGVVSRGIAIYQGLVIAPVIDGRLEALDAETGKPVWESRVGYPQDNFTITMAPRIARGKVIIGASGGDHPTRGYFDAYDALTGRRLWRFFTVPGDPAKGFENGAMKKAAATWEKDWWKLGGGGAVWDGMSYDAEEDLIYVGTGNAYPWSQSFRGGDGRDNLYTASILAVHGTSGELRWYYQPVPGDSWDFDSVQQLVLADLKIHGRLRKVVMQANKNGFFYVLDRITGQFISAKPFAQVSWATGIDDKSGRPIVSSEARYGTDPVIIFPGGSGAHNTAPMSFSPLTGLVYIPTSAASRGTYFAPPTFDPKLGEAQMRLPRGAAAPSRPLLSSIGPPAPDWGVDSLVAWDPIRQQMLWRMPGGGSITGGTVATAGNLVFQSVRDGRLIAYSADKGEKLFEVQTGLETAFPGGMGPPITYQLGEHQYVAVMGGTGPRPGTSLSAGPTPPRPKLLVYALSAK